MKHKGFRVRSAEDECMVSDWEPEGGGDEHATVEIMYAMAELHERAPLLRRFISAAPEKHRADRRTFADALAEHAGFSDAEIRRMEHLRDHQSPAGGWVLV
jgi:hypothetical protein